MISIIVTIYNLEGYIGRCVESVLHQSFRDYELLLIDDGSIDKSGKICDEYAIKDDRVRAFHIPNGGAANARIYGIEQAKGEWITFIDGDDTIPDKALSLLINLANQKGCDIVAGTFNVITPVSNKKFIHKIGEGEFNSTQYIRSILEGNTSVGLCAKLYKASLFSVERKHVLRRIKNNEDLMMLIMCATKAKKIVVSNSIIAYNYIRRNNSASCSVMGYKDWGLLFEIMESFFEKNEMSADVKDSFYSYKVDTLYNCSIVCGHRFPENETFISCVLKNAASYPLNMRRSVEIIIMNHDILRIITQTIFCIKRKLFAIAKAMIKVIIN